MSKKFSNFAFEMKKIYQIPVTEILQLETGVIMQEGLPTSFGHISGGQNLPPIRDARPVF
jgi:hypothetical protein